MGRSTRNIPSRWIIKRFFSEERRGRGRAYFHQPGEEPLRAMTTGQLVDRAALQWPDRLAVLSLHENRSLSFSDVKQQSEQLGASLLKLGLSPGDRIAVLGTNRIFWYLTMQAAAKAGLILVTINPGYRGMELQGALASVGAKCIVCEDAYKSQNYHELLCEVMPGLGRSPHGQPLSSGSSLPSLRYIVVATQDRLPGAYRFDDVMGLADSKDMVEKLKNIIQPDDPSCIQFSSGTTGTPKAAVLTHFGTINNGYFFGRRCGFHTKHHSVCLQVPMFHIFGSTLGLLSSISHGNTLVLPSPTFNKHATITALLKHRCNVIYGTPTMYVDLCSALAGELPSSAELQAAVSEFDVVVSGGAICPPQLFQDIATTLSCSNVQSAYGLTETSPITFTNTRNDTFQQRTQTVGLVADHLEVKIVDNEGRMVDFGSPGEVWFRSYANLRGYWDDEEKTREAITACRWFRSGDLMVLTEDGYGTIVGRLKDVIIRGGENIFPSEIEKFLLTHPDILDVHVCGVADKRMGEEIAANIKVKEKSTVTEDDVKEFCKGKISHFKIPKYVRFVDDYPKTESGKVKKYLLKENLEKELNISSI